KRTFPPKRASRLKNSWRLFLNTISLVVCRVRSGPINPGKKSMKAEQCVKSSTAFVAGVLIACVFLPGTTIAACENNTNTDLVKNGGFESGSGTSITDWKVEWPPHVDPFVYIDTSRPHSGAQDLALGSTKAPNDIVQ